MRNLVEFYCTKSGGGCGGYFTVLVNVALNGVFEVVCPKCKHKHRRTIKGGEITDNSRWNRDPQQEILGNIAAYSLYPRSNLSKYRSGRFKEERQSVVLERAEDRSFIEDRWFEIHGSK